MIYLFSHINSTNKTAWINIRESIDMQAGLMLILGFAGMIKIRDVSNALQRGKNLCRVYDRERRL